MSEKRYLVIGGKVFSKDREIHYVSPRQLADLYGVPLNECLLAESNGDSKLMGLDGSRFIILRPRNDGRYEP